MPEEMLVFDTEVFPQNFVFVAKIYGTDNYVEITSAEDMQEFYQQFRNWLWIGYNSSHYDVPVIQAVLRGENPYATSQRIITEDQYTAPDPKFPINTYDCFTRVTDRSMQYGVSLKTMEAYIGLSIEETSVPFDINRALTAEELKDAVTYCRHDVDATEAVCRAQNQLTGDMDARIGLVKEYLDPSDISRTKAQLVTKIMKQPRGSQHTAAIEELTLPENLTDGLEGDQRDLPNWFRQHYRDAGRPEIKSRIGTLEITYAFGGAHGGKQTAAEGRIWEIDAASMYPNIIVNYNLFPTGCYPELYREMLHNRLEWKKAGDPRAKSSKIVLNSFFGITGHQHSELYNPAVNRSICCCGQLAITKLAQAMAQYGELLQVNTDAVMIRLDDNADEQEVRQTIDNVGKITKLTFEIEEYSCLIQRDVNNYIALKSDGTYTAKGKNLKAPTALDNDCSIIQKAVVNYILTGDYKQFIEGQNSLIDYQLIYRQGKAYEATYWGNMEMQATNRAFASYAGDPLVKVKNGKRQKYPNTPDRVFVDNGDIRGKLCPAELDKKWYCWQIERKLNELGLLDQKITAVFTKDAEREELTEPPEPEEVPEAPDTAGSITGKELDEWEQNPVILTPRDIQIKAAYEKWQNDPTTIELMDAIRSLAKRFSQYKKEHPEAWNAVKRAKNPPEGSPPNTLAAWLLDRPECIPFPTKKGLLSFDELAAIHTKTQGRAYDQITAVRIFNAGFFADCSKEERLKIINSFEAE